MNQQNPIPEHVWTLINEFLDQTITEEGIAQLELALSDNPFAQREFFHYAQLHVNLDTDARMQRVISSFVEQRKSSQASDSISAPLPTNSNGGAVLGSDSVSPMSPTNFFNVGLGLLAVIAIGLLVWNPWKHTPSQNQEPLAVSPPKTREPITVAPRSGLFPEVKSIRLTSGAVSIDVDKVGSIVVEAVNGPAEFELIGPLRARLSQGRIRMRVSEKTGQGFVIETPGGEVTDLGTEFVLDVTGGKKSELLVLAGAVDLRLTQSQSTDPPKQQRLEVGEGVAYSENGVLQRVNSIIRGDMTQTYLHSNEMMDRKFNPVIVKVTDNLATKKFYEIIPGGLKEDASRCVDREEAEWNGATPEGMPSYLVGADYIKNFADDLKKEKLKINVTLDRPAKLYVFYSDFLKPPKWLISSFRKTGDKIGSDAGKMSKTTLGVGAGVSVDDTYDIWEQIVTEPKTVTLGAVEPVIDPTTKRKKFFAIYGIAAVPLENKKAEITITQELELGPNHFEVH